MTDEQKLERRRLAYRRAGHAVARCTQGGPVPDLSLEPPGQSATATGDLPRGWEIDLGSRARHRTELEMIARWTGLAAESRACFGDREPPDGWGPAREPIAALGRRVTRSLDENDAYLEWLRRRALGLLDIAPIWAAIEAVATALLEKEEVSSGEAVEIVAAVQRTGRRRVGLAGIFRNPR
jgi:hypothetical protein